MAKDKVTETNKKDEASTSGIWKDPRFSNLINDPRFKKLPKVRQKVKIDKRFQSMFENDKFKVTYTRDKYGRKVNKTSKDDLEKYYRMSSEDDEESDVEKEILKEQKAIEEQSESESEEVVEKAQEKPDTDEFGNSLLEPVNTEKISINLKSKLADLDVDYARGEAPLVSDSSSDEEASGEEDENELFLDHVWGELDAEAERTEESTTRIAACNMDWDRIRAVDIMILCHSFLPPGGIIKKVSVYPSEFGKERMKEEEITGPTELIKEENPSDSDHSDIEAKEEDAEEAEYHREKLRQYQLNRLKYFYAVIECDSIATADKIYAECDGLEYESTANKLDFRFIPVDVAFDDDEPRDVCEELPDLSKYKPRIFTTKALQQGKVELTWDENDMERQEIQEKLQNGELKDVPESLLKKYVACSSSSEDEAEVSENGMKNDEEAVDQKVVRPSKKGTNIGKYKALLKDINEKENEQKQQQIEREFTWGIGVESDLSSKKISKVSQELTPFDQMMAKKKEKRKARKDEIKQRKKGNDHVSSDTEDDEDLPDGIDLNDPYFAEEFNNDEFEPISKKKNKQKKGNTKDDDEKKQKDEELALLLADGADDGRSHFSLKKIQETENESKSKKKRKFKKKNRDTLQQKETLEDDFSLRVDDDRFGAIFSKPEYNIDPTNPQFKKTKNMDRLIHEKLKRKPMEGELDRSEMAPKKTKIDTEVNMLLKSIKRKVKGQ